MRVQSMHFQARAGEKLADTRLQRNLKKTGGEVRLGPCHRDAGN